MKFVVSLLAISFVVIGAYAQSPKDKATAAERTAKAVKVLEQFKAFGPASVPIETLRNAKAIVVFPNISKVNILFSKLSMGNGLAVVRTESGWGMPIFLSFKAADMNFKLAGKGSFDAVFLFMSDEAVAWLKEGDVPISSDKFFAVGPVIGGDETKRVLDNATILYYSLNEGKLIDANLNSNALYGGFTIFHDNNFNKAIFGSKTKPLLNDSAKDIKVPAEIEKFRESIVGIAEVTK